MSGKAGLEKQYNDMLMGTDGLRRVIVNSVGKETGRLEQTEPIPGKPITLTIDYDVQAAAEAALGDMKGAVVAMDPQNGRNSGVREPSRAGPEFVCGAHLKTGMAAAEFRSGFAADESRDSGTTRAGFCF